MTKKTKKVIFGIVSVIIILVLAAGYIFNQVFLKPESDAIAEAKFRAAYLLQIQDKTPLKMVGEAGMAETIDNNNHCYTYAFQGASGYLVVKGAATSLITGAGYTLDPETIVDSGNTYKIVGKSDDGWTTQLQVLNDSALVDVSEDIIDNPVSTKVQSGQILVSGQVCNI